MRLINALRILPVCLALPLAACAPEETSEPVVDNGSGLTVEQLAEGFGATWEERTRPEEKGDGLSCSGVWPPDRRGFGKRVALTFDDGPTARTEKVMEALREFDAPGTFFVLGKLAVTSRGKRLIAEMEADPLFLVGNHSYNHPDFKTLNDQRLASEIDTTQEAIVEAGSTPKFFRFPYGSSDCHTAAAVRARGMRITGWHIDSADWCFNAGNGTCRASTFRHVPDQFRNDMVAYVLHQVRANNGGILLFHDVHGYTANNIRIILQALKDEGFTFTGLDDVDAFPLLNGQDPEALPFIGDTCDSDADCDFQAGRGFCHPVGFCTLACEGTCPDRPGKASTFCVADNVQDRLSGICVSQAQPLNSMCDDVQGSLHASADRFIGTSSSRAATKEVCLPDPAALTPAEPEPTEGDDVAPAADEPALDDEEPAPEGEDDEG